MAATHTGVNPAQRVRRSAIARFFEGFAAPVRGLRYMNVHPALWRHGILPVLLNIVLTVAVIGLMIWGGHGAAMWLQGQIPEGAGWVILRVLSYLLLGVLIAGLAIVTWIAMQGILCGYFYSKLAREVEIQLGLKPGAMREVPLLYQITDALLDVSVLMAVTIGCLVVGFVPLIGPPLALGFGGYFNCFIFGMDYLDYPQALRARGRKEQRDFARRHRAETLGLGASVMLISFLPLISPVFLTTAAVGSVLLYRKLDGPGLSAGATKVA